MTEFSANWSAKILERPPLILPTRHYVYPQRVEGEEDALERGAMLVEVKPSTGAAFLATCALGFKDASLPSGAWNCPSAEYALLIAGGYAYLVDTAAPEQCIFLPQRPVTAVLAAPEDGLLLLAGFHDVLAIGTQGIVWRTARLSWEGVTLGAVHDGVLHGTGWSMPDDRDVAFEVDLRDGTHRGGGYRG